MVLRDQYLTILQLSSFLSICSYWAHWQQILPLISTGRNQKYHFQLMSEVKEMKPIRHIPMRGLNRELSFLHKKFQGEVK